MEDHNELWFMISIIKVSYGTEGWAQLQYEALPKVRKLVFEIPNVQASHDSVCMGCSNWDHSPPKNIGPMILFNLSILTYVELCQCKFVVPISTI